MAIQELYNGETPRKVEYDPLYLYQQQTPASYSNAKPRLHAYAAGAVVKIVPRQWTFDGPLQALTIPDLDSEDDDGLENTFEHAAPPPGADGFLHCPDVEVWVTSKYAADHIRPLFVQPLTVRGSELILSRPAIPSGISMSYLSMPIAGVEGDKLYIQLSDADEDTPDDEITITEIRVIATEVDSYDQGDIASGAGTLNADGSIKITTNVSTVLQRAVTACQEENPDPPVIGDEEQDGDAMDIDTRPGAGGWITSENMHEYVDENGNFRLPNGEFAFDNDEGRVVADEEVNGILNGNGHVEEQEPLGLGAGRTRTAAEAVAGGTLEEADRPGPSASGT
ncbi:hypothetical protein DOTSEDRAFT_25490 [Dothistroma septosporum NZE10]|uniref:Uncharacterized protein n=1 Tax=Dothistroma septosporum (strain NZE10 / CBS 128990) TaxID=675120 RepID=M2Y5P3_DOTSN|nr:hypothetical protein DOTSEDRAFT_25490 [Dothistroma septosporum NZE10]